MRGNPLSRTIHGTGRFRFTYMKTHKNQPFHVGNKYTIRTVRPMDPMGSSHGYIKSPHPGTGGLMSLGVLHTWMSRICQDAAPRSSPSLGHSIWLSTAMGSDRTVLGIRITANKCSKNKSKKSSYQNKVFQVYKIPTWLEVFKSHQISEKWMETETKSVAAEPAHLVSL